MVDDKAVCSCGAFADYSGLNVFLKGLNPNFKLVSGKTVRSHMFKHYETAKVAVQELISKQGNSMFSATTDLWTSEHQNTGYICVTLHWINAEFEFKYFWRRFWVDSPPKFLSFGLVSKITAVILQCM